MGSWYLIGLLAGMGVALGVVCTGLLAPLRFGTLWALVLSAAIAVGIGLGVGHWQEALAGGLGAACGVAGARAVVGGALARGGTRGGTALLVALAALAIAALAFVPALGYVEAVLLPALGARLRSRGGKRYAGLRILAKD